MMFQLLFLFILSASTTAQNLRSDSEWSRFTQYQKDFGKIYASLDELEVRYHYFKNTLFTIANHLIIDWYRKKKPVSLEGLAGPEDEEISGCCDGGEGVHGILPCQR